MIGFASITKFVQALGARHQQVKDMSTISHPRLIAIGGLSGTGKSTLARWLAHRLGAAHIRSDVERKALFGVAEIERLPPKAYTRDVTLKVYESVLANARLALSLGGSVVVDAVFLRHEERVALEDVARSFSVPFHGLWLVASHEIMMMRVDARSGDASDATSDIVRQQLELDAHLESLSAAWTMLASDGSPEVVEGKACELLGLVSGSQPS